MEYLHSVCLSQVHRRPAAIAIQDQTGIYSYSALAERAAAWSRQLQERGLRPGERIVLVADAGFDSIAALLGCSMSGLVFTVISPDVPPARRDLIVADLDPSAVLMDAHALDLASAQSDAENLLFERFQIRCRIAAAAGKRSGARCSLDPCYIVFTSGSTGRPKGIVMSHRAVVSFWQGLIEHAQLDPAKRYASLSPLQFDFSLLDIGLCLGSGATLLLPNRALLRKPALLVEQLATWEATHFSGVPTIWKLILQSAPTSIRKLVKLERIAFAGEHFPVENMAAIHDMLPQIDFYNIYGQSESIACTFQVLGPQIFRSGQPHLPVGPGHRDMEMMLIDEDGKLVTQAGTPAELYLRGAPLFSGYWNNPEESARRLIQNPLHRSYSDPVFRSGDICYFDEAGLYYFIGRKDNQIKVNGNRVELEEIESALNRFPEVLNSCVLAVEDGAGHALHAALVVKNLRERQSAESESSMRSFLAAGLPAYMLPRHYHFLEAIPISENGKNDRKKLSNLLGLSS